MTEPPVSYDAAQAGKIIHQTANWMITQARAGKIPFTKVGRKKLWTPVQLDEILRARAQKPRLTLAARPPGRRLAAVDSAAGLQARPQRRKSGAA